MDSRTEILALWVSLAVTVGVVACAPWLLDQVVGAACVLRGRAGCVELVRGHDQWLAVGWGLLWVQVLAQGLWTLARTRRRRSGGR